jgi:predicted acyl esterase
MPLVPGQPTMLRFDLLPISYVFKAGHRIQVKLRAARADNTSDRRMLRFTSPEPSRRTLVCGRLAARSPSISKIIRHRYQRGATVLTSNRAVEELAFFGDPLLASAAMDRLA